ncbi:MAG: response regulator transcription factor [Syntrophobacteraceae bacterium]|nr:response regulator transcription factor [Syntrophobacteraceae bacterium]
MCLTLIVEDNATFRRSLRELLFTRFPYMSIEEAVDGNEALHKVNAFTPDIVFMDIKLPGTNGLQLTKNIKQHYSDMIVVILTSHDLPEYREAAFRSGANYFMTKGMATSSDITALVASILSGKTADHGNGSGMMH